MAEQEAAFDASSDLAGPMNSSWELSCARSNFHSWVEELEAGDEAAAIG